MQQGKHWEMQQSSQALNIQVRIYNGKNSLEGKRQISIYSRQQRRNASSAQGRNQKISVKLAQERPQDFAMR
jgi:hypothetical protein